MSKAKDNRQQILVYGAESLGLGYKIPADSIDSSQYILKFGKVNTEDDLSDYDGVIFSLILSRVMIVLKFSAPIKGRCLRG